MGSMHQKAGIPPQTINSKTSENDKVHSRPPSLSEVEAALHVYNYVKWLTVLSELSTWKMLEILHRRAVDVDFKRAYDNIDRNTPIS